MVDRTCRQCGRPFRTDISPSSPPGRGNFCSRQCLADSRNFQKEVECGFCGRRFRRQLAEVGRTANFCDVECYQSWKRANANPRGYVKARRGGTREHRLVAEAMIGRPLLPGEVVHHIDRNSKNNDPSNLMVLTQSEHAKLHHREDGHPRWGKKG